MEMKETGNRCFNQGYYESAITWFEKAIESDPSQSIFYSNTARCYKKLGNQRRCEQYCTKALHYDATNIKAWIMRGEAHIAIAKETENTRYAELAVDDMAKALPIANSVNRGKNVFLQAIETTREKAEGLLKYLRLKLERDELLLFESEVQGILRRRAEQCLAESERLAEAERLLSECLAKNHKGFEERMDQRVPSYVVCSITQEVMRDPVTTETGNTYERGAI